MLANEFVTADGSPAPATAARVQQAATTQRVKALRREVPTVRVGTSGGRQSFWGEPPSSRLSPWIPTALAPPLHRNVVRPTEHEETHGVPREAQVTLMAPVTMAKRM